jgi:two-component system sensor histidine kinase VanS
MLVCVTVFLFSQQFLSFYNTAQIQQLNNSYQSLYSQLHGKNEDDIVIIARQFYENNQSFSFYIKYNGGRVIFTTPNIDPDIIPDSNNFRIIMSIDKEYILGATNQDAAKTDYGNLISKSLLALACMLGLGVTGAFIFARQITKPIKQLADDTKKMANLEVVQPAPERADELGDLARDVHAMYDKLKETISKLEDEILREREMEETQRYFFSAASHELKTPIAAISILLEGMLENLGDYKDHNKYLRECVKMTDAQSKMISEILEIVNLNDGKIVPVPEKLDIGQIVADLLPNFQTLAEADEKHIVNNVSDGETVLADSKMLKKAISNIVLNAVQNTPKGGEIRIWTEPVADQYRLCVLNSGAKINDAVLPKLFDPFYRVDKARNRKDGRSGLGLTIVQKTLEAMKIDFSLENTPDGVLFWLDLPEI